MKIYSGFHDKTLKPRPRAVAIGVFDGVHRGHQRILKKILKDAKEKKWKSMIITFDPQPNKVLRPNAPHPILISLSHRLRFFEQMGIDEAIVIRFNRQFSKISHLFFLEQLLLKKAGLRSLAVGHDFCFGYKGRGNGSFLSDESKKLGFRFNEVPPLRQSGEIISSTAIRALIERGKLERAEKMLGRPVSVYGNVVRGRRRGRGIGFPTANLNPHHETLPPRGVYAAWGLLGRRKLKGVVHIGERPTFGDREKALEVHFLDFHQNIYGKELELLFVKRLRHTQKFKSKHLLAGAIKKDAKSAWALSK